MFLPKFEHHTKPVASRERFNRRVWRVFILALMIICLMLGIGVLGYHCFEGLPWVDALLNASMILGGMGPVNPIVTFGGKLFASWYALMSGLVFVGLSAILFAPFLHRFLHMFLIDARDIEERE